MLFRESVEVSRSVARTMSRNEKTALLAAALRRMSREELSTGASYLAGEVPQGRIGIGYSQLHSDESPGPASVASLSFGDVARQLDVLAAVKG